MQKVLKKQHVVAHPDTQEVVTMFEGKDGKSYGRVRIDSSTIGVVNNLTVISKRSALVTITEDVLDAIEDSIVAGKPYPIDGVLQIIETVEPSYPTQKPKTKGADGEVITHGGQPVYRTTIFNTDVNAVDTILISDSAPVVITADPNQASNETQDATATSASTPAVDATATPE